MQPSRRQSELVLRDQLTTGKAELNPVEVNRKALAELNQEEVNRRSGSGFNQFQLDALSEHNICRCLKCAINNLDPGESTRNNLNIYSYSQGEAWGLSP